MPLEERKFKDLKEQNFGDQGWQGEQAKICGAIMAETGETEPFSIVRHNKIKTEQCPVA